MGVCTYLGTYTFRKHSPNGPIYLVDTGFIPNLLVWLAIGFLLGSSIGGFVHDGPLVDRSESRFTLRALLCVVAWFALLLYVTIYIYKHARGL